MFKKILIANRGEIACRIIKTAKRLGISTVAVYATHDAHALPVLEADEGYHLNGVFPAETYLNIPKIIEAALTTGAEAIHPGYGFLSENAAFAEACLLNRLVFIGPSVSVLKTMGNKESAKSIARQANIPLLPSFYAEDTSEAVWVSEAQKIGFPVLIKPVAGGGGKGMHLVQDASALIQGLPVARREAKTAFGDERLLLEKHLTEPEHIEVQIFGDTQGHLVHLFERNCSVQRRHQKILEESPAHLSQALRESMCNTAIRCAEAIHYTGAGTVEFLLDKQTHFYFMEMNTRLQVEHPVTEMITGLDLVEWQLLVAAGKPLPLTQKEITQKGHAIEARIYAETPKENFLPSAGTLLHLKQPPETDYLRVDSGIASGDLIRIYGDPMLAKLIAWGKTRLEAIQILTTALTQYEILGIETNLSFLQKVLRHEDFQQTKIHTSWVETHFTELTTPSRHYLLFLIWATVAHLLETKTESYSPWYTLAGWTMMGTPRQQWIKLQDKMGAHTVGVEFLEAQQFRLTFQNQHFLVSGRFLDKTHLKIQFNQQVYKIIALKQEHTWRIGYQGEQAVFEVAKGDTELSLEDTSTEVVAPMSARVVAVLVTSGQSVKKGEKLVLLEAMKMEHTLYAPYDGIVKSLYCKEGGLVEEGMLLVDFV